MRFTNWLQSKNISNDISFNLKPLKPFIFKYDSIFGSWLVYLSCLYNIKVEYELQRRKLRICLSIQTKWRWNQSKSIIKFWTYSLDREIKKKNWVWFRHILDIIILFQWCSFCLKIHTSIAVDLIHSIMVNVLDLHVKYFIY